MNPTIILPPDAMARFQRDLKLLVESSSRSAPKVLNSKAHAILLGALRSTKRAERAKIEAESGVMVSSGARGREAKVAAYINSLIHHRGGSGAAEYIRQKFPAGPKKGRGAVGRIAAAHGASAQLLSAASRRWIGGKIRAIGFLQKTWMPALGKLRRFATGETANSPSRVRLAAVGTFAIPATEAKLEVKFGNTVGADSYGVNLSAQAGDYLVGALRRAWGREMHEGFWHLLEKGIMKDLRRSGFDVRQT